MPSRQNLESTVGEDYKRLAVGIVMQAVDDYKAVLKKPWKNQADCNREELELFFRSEWVKILTDIDMKMAMEHLKRKAGVV